jgi:1-deoxy-D-xylulose-5-phosphate synthase
VDYKILGKKDLTPVALKAMSNEERVQLCAELRDKILNSVSKNGGHLAVNIAEQA